jgi:hypothetical protein
MSSAARGAGQRLAAGIVDHLRGDPRRQDQGFAELEREVFGVGGERGHLQRFDRAFGAGGGNRAEAFSGVSLRLCRISARSRRSPRKTCR